MKWSILRNQYNTLKIWRIGVDDPFLINPDYAKTILILSFASTNTIAVFLLQKNQEEHKRPIEFFSKSLRDVELKYSVLEK